MSERAIASGGRTVPLQLVAVAAGLVIWELAGRWLGFVFLPPFTQVLHATWELALAGKIIGNLAASLASLTVGYGLAVVLGVPVGALMGRYRAVEYLLDLYLNAFLAAPTLIFVPVLFALFGVSRLSQVAVVFIYAFFVIVANTLTGIRMLDANCLEMARSFGASERQLFWKVMLPGAVPMIMAGLRIGMARAVKGMINGEMLIALVGLGALIKTYGGRFEMDRVLGILMVVISVALVCTGLMQALDRRLTRWTG
jgi:ABC-type nitrate/sulfonate/bicarbonate transport system permease component